MKKILLILTLLFLPYCFADDLDKQISQMIIIGFDGNTTHSKGFKRVLKQLKNDEISGVILFSKNIKSKNELTKMTKSLTEASKIPPFISIDNEGGKIQRYNFEQYKSAKELSHLSLDDARSEYSKMAELEKNLGINFNFAPCVDLEINKHSIIAKKQRSYGEDYKKVSQYARVFIEEHNKRKIITSIKHFPGHGSPSGDTHRGFVSSSETFLKEEILPYYELKDLDELNTVMISHIYNSKFDDEYPASLSKKIIKDFLINSIGFKGIIVSDDYDMGAIRNNYTLEEIVVGAVNAGVNILLFSNNIQSKDKNLALKIRSIIKTGIQNGTIDIQDIKNSSEKILKLKNNLN